MVAFTLILAILVLGLVARWVVAALPGDGLQLAARDAQIRQLRDEMDALQSEVRRLSEEQSFMVRLLAAGEARPTGALKPPTSEPQSETP